jgi:glycosyltransferase involved in cell wall biosynthesis
MRIAWFTPWPPQPSGVAGRSAEIVPLIVAAGHGVDVFVDHAQVDVTRKADADRPVPGHLRVLSAHDFVWRAGLGQYDVAVYQIGNSTTHEFIWPYLFRWPGLTVLHDTHLHHARGRALLSRKRAAEYRSEFTWNHPDVRADAAELAVRGFDGAYYYDWPMVRAVVASSRVVASHSRGSLAGLQASWPDRSFEYIALAEGCRAVPTEEARKAVRSALAIPESAVVFGVFGALTAEKRIPQVLRAFAETYARAPQAVLVLAGRRDASVDIDGLIAALGIGGATRILEGLDDAQFDRTIAAVDVSLNLRWPTSREMSGPWVRALAAGRATVIVDLVHLALVPSLDPRTWRRHSPGGAAIAADRSEPITVAVDILDEDHSLRRAMRRLARDRDLRDEIGRAARRHWEAEHSFDRAVRDYERAMTRAASTPDPVADRPPHLRPMAFDQARGLAAEFGDDAMREIEMLEKSQEARKLGSQEA